MSRIERALARARAERQDGALPLVEAGGAPSPGPPSDRNGTKLPWGEITFRSDDRAMLMPAQPVTGPIDGAALTVSSADGNSSGPLLRLLEGLDTRLAEFQTRRDEEALQHIRRHEPEPQPTPPAVEPFARSVDETVTKRWWGWRVIEASGAWWRRLTGTLPR